MSDPLDVGDTTRESLNRLASSQGDLNIGVGPDDAAEENNARVVRIATVDCIFERVSICLITDKVRVGEF